MLLPVLVLLTGVALLLVLASDARSEREKAYTMAEMNAVSYEVVPTGGWNGGDEFCVLLMNTTIAASDERIRSFAARQRTFCAEGRARNFPISLGYAEYPRQASSVSALLSRADMALYEVKMGGKGGCLAYDDQICGKKERTQLGFVLNDISETCRVRSSFTKRIKPMTISSLPTRS